MHKKIQAGSFTWIFHEKADALAKKLLYNRIPELSG